MRLNREIQHLETNDQNKQAETEHDKDQDNLNTQDKPINVETTETQQTAAAVIEETRDLMQEIMTLDEEDLKVIIGDKVTQRKIDIYKE